MRWPWQKRRRHRRHREPVGPQWNPAAAHERTCVLIEALALQGVEQYDAALELVGFDAIQNDRHPIWDHELLCRGITILLNVQLELVLNERRLEPVAEVIPLRPLARCEGCPTRDNCEQLEA